MNKFYYYILIDFIDFCSLYATHLQHVNRKANYIDIDKFKESLNMSKSPPKIFTKFRLTTFSGIFSNFTIWHCLSFGYYFSRVLTKLYRQTIGIPMETNCAPFVADLFLFCYEKDFINSASQWKISLTSLRLLIPLQDTLIDNIYIDQMVDRLYPTAFHICKTNSSDTEAPFVDLNLVYQMIQCPP